MKSRKFMHDLRKLNKALPFLSMNTQAAQRELDKSKKKVKELKRQIKELEAKNASEGTDKTTPDA